MQYDLYFWIGKDSTQDERGVAAIKTVELDVYLGDKPVQCRVVQGNEPERFVRLFNTNGKGMIVLNGGIDGGFNHVKPDEYEPRLLKVKGKMKAMRVQQVPFKASSLNKGDVFVLDGGLQLWQWNGPEAKACAWWCGGGGGGAGAGAGAGAGGGAGAGAGDVGRWYV